jgi:hypothetical protein
MDNVAEGTHGETAFRAIEGRRVRERSSGRIRKAIGGGDVEAGEGIESEWETLEDGRREWCGGSGEGKRLGRDRLRHGDDGGSGCLKFGEFFARGGPAGVEKSGGWGFGE